MKLDYQLRCYLLLTNSRFPQMKDELADKFSDKKDRLRDKAMAAIKQKKA